MLWDKKVPTAGGSRTPTWFPHRVVTRLTVHIICSIQILTARCFLTSTGLCAVNGACRVFLCACIVYSTEDLAPGQETEVPLQQKHKSPATPLFFNTAHSLMCIIVCLHDIVPVAVQKNAFKPGFNTDLPKTWYKVCLIWILWRWVENCFCVCSRKKKKKPT